MNYKFVTRIAPSPTGQFHIGTARTALINYIFAKQNQGEFLLRMEDTDEARNKPEFEQDIKDGLSWLGLNWDGEVVYQNKRTQRYLDVVSDLKTKNFAYEKDGASWFKIPENREIKFNDLIRGEVVFNTKDLKDFVILRSDGSPIFYLSGVVDDNDSQITHVIRGEEHLSNTPKQILILQALGFEIPTYAHVPLILNADRSKMSKRKDPVSITRDFKQKGYLAEALINYLALLGWHETESQKSVSDIYSLQEIIQKYDISRMQKGGAVFGQTKLDNINHHYIQEKTDEEFLNLVKSYKPTTIDDDRFNKLALICKDRIKKSSDIVNELVWLKDLSDYPKELLIFKNSNEQDTLKSLQKTCEELNNMPSEPEDPKTYHLIMHKVMEDLSLQKGDVFWSARVALSGNKQSPPPEQLMWLIGKDESMERIKKAINKLIINNV